MNLSTRTSEFGSADFLVIQFCCKQMPMTQKQKLNSSCEFSQVWSNSFGSTPPLGHILRRDCIDAWTRFHALPESKRYAETETEREIVASRANTLAQECFGAKSNIWVVTEVYDDYWLKKNGLVHKMDMERSFSWVDLHADAEEQTQISFFIKKFDWKPSSLDWLFTEIAEDRECAILFSGDDKTVFAPYDGGFDIISFLPEKIGNLEAKYRSWMSERSDKL